MKKKILFITLSAIVIIIVVVMLFNMNAENKISEQKKTEDLKKPDTVSNNKTDIINVDYVVENPEKYKGTIGVSGKVVKVDESKNLFMLGCEDACVFMPVKYTGKMPQKDKDVIAFGEIKKSDKGKYIFEAIDCKTK